MPMFKSRFLSTWKWSPSREFEMLFVIITVFFFQLLPSSHAIFSPSRAKDCKNKHLASREKLDRLTRFNHLSCTGHWTSIWTLYSFAASSLAPCTTYKSWTKKTKQKKKTHKHNRKVMLDNFHNKRNIPGFSFSELTKLLETTELYL